MVLLALAAGFWGCSKECPECPECPRVNDPGIDPPYIELVSGPYELEVGQAGDFVCEAVSDTQITGYLWDLTPQTHPGEDYFIPPVGTPEGSFTPTGERPSLFCADDSGSCVSASFDSRGSFAIAVQVEDANGYVKRDGIVVDVSPAEPDTFASPVILYPGVPDTIWGDEFEAFRSGVVATGGCLAAAYPASFDKLQLFAYADTLCEGGEKYVHSWCEVGKLLRVTGDKVTPANITAGFSLKGAAHLWDASPYDYVRLITYIALVPDGGAPLIIHLTSQTVDATEGEAAYCFNTDYEITVHASLQGLTDYVLWFGVSAEVSCSGGAAVCLDNEKDALVALNYVVVELLM